MGEFVICRLQWIVAACKPNVSLTKKLGCYNLPEEIYLACLNLSYPDPNVDLFVLNQKRTLNVLLKYEVLFFWSADWFLHLFAEDRNPILFEGGNQVLVWFWNLYNILVADLVRLDLIHLSHYFLLDLINTTNDVNTLSSVQINWLKDPHILTFRVAFRNHKLLNFWFTFVTFNQTSFNINDCESAFCLGIWF
jgi:hypothetical protein